MKEHPLWTHISRLSHWTALWSFRTAPLHNPQSALQFVQYQDPFPDSNLNSSLSPSLAHDAWNAFHSPCIRRPYQMPCNIFTKAALKPWTGFISITPARMRRVIKLVPFEGLKLRNPSELLRFPSICQTLRYSVGEIFVTNLNVPDLSQYIPLHSFHSIHPWGARWLSGRVSGRVSDSGARGPGFETYRRRVVSLSKTLYSPKVLVNYPGSDGSVPIWLKNCWLGR